MQYYNDAPLDISSVASTSRFDLITSATSTAKPLLRMSQDQDIEHAAQDIDRVAVNMGHALAESYAANFTNGFEESTFEQQRVVEYIFSHAAAEAIEKFPSIKANDRLTLRMCAKATVRRAVTKRLTELNCDGA